MVRFESRRGKGMLTRNCGTVYVALVVLTMVRK
jgi:hypothetical protein